MDIDADSQAKVTHAGELVIRACAVIGTLTIEQQRAVHAATGGRLSDSLASALDTAAGVSPALRQSLRTHPPRGFSAS